MRETIEMIELKKKRDITRLLVGAKFVGEGKASWCFLLQNRFLLKIYKNSSSKRKLFSQFSMKEHICEISTLKNDSCITPSILYTCKNEVIAYITEYKKAKTLKCLNEEADVNIYLNHLDKLLEDTFLLGEHKFELGDVHNKNILFKGYYYLIDFDFGNTEETETTEHINRINRRKVMKTILNTLFELKDWEELYMENTEILALYNQSIYLDHHNIYPFFEYLADLLNKKELKVKDLRHNRVLKKRENTYYKFHL